MDQQQKDNSLVGAQAPVPLESTVPQPAGEAATLPPVYEKVNLVKQSPVFFASLIVFAIDICLLGASYLTNDYSIASNLANMTVWVGLLGAALLGAGMTQLTLRSTDQHGGRLSTQTKLGIIFCILSIIFVPLLIPGVILLLIGLTRPASEEGAPLSRTKRIIFAVGALLGGGITGLVIAVVIAFMTSDRACQLSSSKCI